MTMVLGLITIAMIALSIVFAYVFGYLSFKEKTKQNYSLLQNFPFELQEDKGLCSNLSFIFASLFSLSCLAASTCLFWDSSFYGGYLPLAIALSIVGLGKAVCSLLLFRVPAYSFKFHSLLDVFYFGLSALFCVLSGLTFMNLMKLEQGLGAAFMIIEWVLAIGEIALLANPKIRDWTKLEVSVDKDGNSYASRPKPFVLALSEWIAIGLDLIGSIAFISGISFIVSSMQ